MDIEKIRSLAEIMVEHDLSRIEWQEGESQVLLRRGQPVALSYSPPPAQAAMPAAPPPPAASSDGASAASAPGTARGNEVFIRSPMVGTFYSSADPESPAFVSVGDAVSPDTVVCLVEAMKVFNEIKAEVTGRIEKILVKNGDSVEYGQKMFLLKP
jgi:acetyl-CoA carboxylase biotin carboxyl carrier protein